MRRSRMRGAVAVEMALLLIPLLLMAFGVAEYGRAIYQYNTLVKAVRDSARLLSQYSPSADPGIYSTAQSQAKCLAVHGNTGCSGPTLAPGLTTSMVKISPVSATTSASTTLSMVEVKITGYQYNFVFNPLNLMGNGGPSITLGGADGIGATMRQL